MLPSLSVTETELCTTDHSYFFPPRLPFSYTLVSTILPVFIVGLIGVEHGSPPGL
jgi:hypothetical protein